MCSCPGSQPLLGLGCPFSFLMPLPHSTPPAHPDPSPSFRCFSGISSRLPEIMSIGSHSFSPGGPNGIIRSQSFAGFSGLQERRSRQVPCSLSGISQSGAKGAWGFRRWKRGETELPSPQLAGINLIRLKSPYISSTSLSCYPAS